MNAESHQNGVMSNQLMMLEGGNSAFGDSVFGCVKEGVRCSLYTAKLVLLHDVASHNVNTI